MSKVKHKCYQQFTIFNNQMNTCTLCKECEADKTNSHVIPKFLAKSMLENKGFKRAYLLEVASMANAPKYSQDIEKIDYYFCSECEAYFSILETYMSVRVHSRIRALRYDSQFLSFELGSVIWKECKDVNPTIFHLFIYSIIYRCAITPSGVFKSFQLPEKELTHLREYLHNFKSYNQAELIKKIANDTSSIELTYAIITCETSANATENSIGIHPDARSKNYFRFLLNEYHLFFCFPTFNAGELPFPLPTVNTKDQKLIKIGIINFGEWNDMKASLLNKISKAGVAIAKEKGELDLLFNRLFNNK